MAKEKVKFEERAKKEAEERRKAEEEQRRQEQDLLEKKYMEDYAVWKKACSDIKEKRSAEMSKRLFEHRISLETAATQKRDTAIKAANDKKVEYIKRKADAESTLSSLGFFKFEDKKCQKSTIESSIIAMISEAEEEIRTAEITYDTEIARIASEVSEKETQIVQNVEKEMPLPAEPIKPIF